MSKVRHIYLSFTWEVVSADFLGKHLVVLLHDDPQTILFLILIVLRRVGTKQE